MSFKLKLPLILITFLIGLSSASLAFAATPTFVGSNTGTGTGSTYSVSLTSLTGGSDSSAAEGDLVLVVTGWSSTANGDPGVDTTGYTEVVDIYSSDTRGANLSVSWKFMGSTPDTSVTVRGFNNAANGGATVVYVWRGVDPSTPIDVTPTTTSANNQNSARPNAPSITPSKAGAVIVACGLGTGDTTPQTFTTPSGMSNGVSIAGAGSTMSAIANAASYEWTSGAYDPAAWTGGESTTSDSWTAATLVLRPIQIITQIYRSVGPGATGALASNTSPGTNTITISATNSTATFVTGLANDIGVGDAIVYDSDNSNTLTSADSIAFIHGRTSSTVYTIKTHTGGTPTDLSANDTWAIYRAYTSLYNAEAGTKNTSIPMTFNGGNRDLVANGEQWNIACYANGTTADTTAVTVDGWNTGTNNFIRIFTPVSVTEVGVSQRHDGKWDENKYRLAGTVTGSDTGMMLIQDLHVRIDGLQMRLTDMTANSQIILGLMNQSGSPEVYVSNNIIRGVATISYLEHLGILFYYDPTGGKGYVYNNIVYDFGYNDDMSAAIMAVGDGDRYFYNNTIHNSYSGFSDWSSNSSLKNNIVQNCVFGYNGTFDSSSDYNLSDLASDGPSPSYRYGLATEVTFVDEANDDFHLAQTDLYAKDFGTNLSSDTYLPFSTDIDGATRTSVTAWDIGADETATRIFRSVGPSATGALATDSSHANTITLASGVATFSAALADNIGVGDAVIIDTGGTDQAIDASDTLLFIHSRTSSTSYTLRTHTGATPSDISINDTWQIYRAYTSLANAEAGTKNTSIPIAFNGGDRDLVTNNEEWNIACYANGTTSDSTDNQIGGWSTGFQNFIKIYTPVSTGEVGVSQRHTGKWDENKWYIKKTNDWGSLVVTGEDNVIFEGLQIGTSARYHSGLSINYDDSVGETGSISVTNCIFLRESAESSGYTGINVDYENSGYHKLTVKNCVIDGFDSGFNLNVNGNIQKIYIYNNTVSNASYFMFRGRYMKVVNNLMTNVGYFMDDGGPIAPVNISDVSHLVTDGTVSFDTTGFTSIYENQSIDFVNPDNHDFHLSQSDTSARGLGINLTNDIYSPFSTDIDGQLRNPSGAGWDIGADEGTVEFVATVMQTGGNFSTLSSWEDAIDSDLVADTTRVFSHGGITGTIVGGNTVTGLTSGATATVVYATATQILLHTVNGIFQAGETVQVSAGNSLVISDNGNPASAVAKIDGAWTVADTTAVDIFGWTSGPDNYIKIYTTPTARHSGKWDTGKYRLGQNVSGGYLVISDNYTIVDGIQIQSRSVHNNIGISIFADEAIIKNNIIKDINTGIYVGYTLNAYIYNNLIYNVSFTALYIHSYAESYIYGNTLVTNVNNVEYPISSNALLLNFGSNQRVINNITQGFTVFKSGTGGFHSSSDYNITDTATASGGVHDKASTTVSFVSTTAGSEDFHLSQSDTAAKNAGTDLSTYFSTDIDGATRKSVAQQSGSDDFTTDPSSRWTSLVGTFNWGSGAYTNDSGGAHDFSIYNNPTGTTAQYVKVNAYESKSHGAKGVVMRSTGTASDGYYVIVTGQTDYNAWITYADETGWVEDMASASFPHDFSTSSPGDSFGFTIEGSGTGTVARIWINPVNNSPFSSGAWDYASDMADAVISLSAYAGSNFANTGKYVGIGTWDNSSLITYDNFYGGSIAETWDIGADETATQIFRSVGPSATGILDSDNSHADELLSITSGVATFEVAVADNIGVGDVLIVDTNNDETITSADTLLFISGRNSSTSYNLRTHTGAVPANITSNDTWQIYRAHTSLANAEAGTINSTLSTMGFAQFNGGNRDLMTNNEEWNIACYANGTTADTTAVTVDGWVTGAYNFLKVYTPVNANEAGVSQRHGGKWDEGKYLFSYGNNLGNAINILEEYVKIDGLQISVTNQTYDKTAINVDPTNDLEGIIDISNNIFKAVSVSTNGLGAIWTWYNSSGGTAVVNVFNNSFFDFDNGAGGTTVSFYYYAYFNFFNNTIYNSAFGVNANSWDGVMAKNNIINDCSDDCYYTSFSWRDGTSNNISSDGTAPGANSKINTTVSFIDVANKDFHLSQSDTAAKNAGTDLSTYFSTDIDGASRNSSINVWDIGADETATQIYRSVGPSATGLLASDSSHANTVTLTSGVATFSVALADNIGVGDAVIIDTGGTDQAIDASDTLLFIKARNSSTSYQLQSNDGSVPGDIPINDTYQIYRAYTSLYNAEAGTKNTSIPITFNGGNRDLLTNNEEWNIACYANGTTIDSNPVTVDGWITGGDNFIKIYTPTLSTEVGVSQRHGGKWDDSKYNLKTSSVSDCIRISDPYTVLDGIQIYLNNTIMSSVAPWATNVTISNNIIKRNNDGEGNNAGITSGENFVFIFNNIIYNFGNGIHASGNSTNWYINNNTIYNCINGIARYNGIIVAKNNIAQNCTDGFVGTFDSASDYNISDLASDAPGSNSKNSTTVEFVNEAGYDFHLAQTDTAARGAGANLTADANLPFSTDIDGQLRNPSGAGWDIGADEGTVEFVATVMQSGGNFSTLSSWEDAIDSDLVADTTRVFAHGGITGTIVGGNTVTGLTSGATATVVYATSTQILLHTVSGIFQSGETLQVTAGNSVVISDNGNPASAVAKIDGAWTVADTTAVDINGWTSGPDNYIKVYTTEAARHKGKWDDGKYRLISSISSNYIRAPYVRFDGLQISSSANYSGAANFITGSINSSISNSIIKAGGIPADSLGGIANSGGIGTKVINSIVYGYKNGSLVGFRGIQASIGDISVYNTTVANCHYGFYQSHQNIKAVNTISFQNDIGHNLPKTSYISGTNYNISSDSTAPGSSGSKINAEVKFISTETGNEDFHLHPDDRFAIDAGTDLSTYFTNDIDGMPRSGSWDIGADELPTQIYRSVGPSKTDTLDNDTSHSKNVTLTGGVATFSAPLPDNVGVGDVVIIDTDNDEAITSADTLLFISKRNSSTSYQLQTHTGATPSDITINDTYQIYRAHTSLANAESGTINSTLSGLGFTFNGGDRDLVANNEQWNIACYANGTTADTTSVTVDGWITGENNFIKIYTPVRLNEVGVSQRHDGKNDLVENYKISNIASLSAIYLYVNYVVVEGVEISNYGSVGYSVAAINLYNSNYSSISHNLIYDEVSGNNGYAISIPNYGYRGSKIFNNIIYNVFTGIRDNRGDNNLIYIYNNTISSCSNVGIYSGAAGTLVKNNIVQSCADGYSGTFDASSDYNISDLASDAPGTNSKNSTNVLFLDEVGYDFRLSSDDTAAKGAGLNLSTDADLSFFDDIRGQARPKSPEAWSIGASEPQSAGKIKLEGTQIKMEGDAKFE